MELQYCLMFIGAVLVAATSGETVRVTTIKEEPYLKMDGTKYTGFIPDLMEAIADKANIDYRFQIVRDGRYGSKENGQWNGMVRELLDDRADIAAASITINKERKEVIDFSQPFMSFGTTIMIKRPDEGEDKPFNSAQELADQDKIGYGIVKHGETWRFFKTSTKSPYDKMWDYMDSHKDKLVTNINDGIKKVRDLDGKYAFIIESSTADYWTNQEPCDLVTVGDKFNDKSYGFGVRKNDRLKKKIDDAMKELKNEGKIEELRKKYWNHDAECPNSASTSLITLSTWTISLFMALIFSR